jgi:hypothetical protein
MMVAVHGMVDVQIQVNLLVMMDHVYGPLGSVMAQLSLEMVVGVQTVLIVLMKVRTVVVALMVETTLAQIVQIYMVVMVYLIVV